MDILAGVSSEWLKNLTWIAAVLAGAAVLLLQRFRRPDLAALAGVGVYIAGTLGAGIYVLNHLQDGRWGGNEEARMDPPSFTETPMVGQFLGPLDDALGSVADGYNEFLDFRAALAVAVEYFAAAGWALAILVPLGLVSLVVQVVVARRRAARTRAAVAEVARLRDDLERLKRHVGYPVDEMF